MSESADNELLEQFVRNESEAAFDMLVQRHIALVYSVALRHTANPEHAQDITQAVFIILARKAASLSPKTVLCGWLHRTTRYVAANTLQSEFRRQRR
jgi:DNA-directed RNA polymerase specialized sigma24 family protein